MSGKFCLLFLEVAAAARGEKLWHRFVSVHAHRAPSRALSVKSWLLLTLNAFVEWNFDVVSFFHLNLAVVSPHYLDSQCSWMFKMTNDMKFTQSSGWVKSNLMLTNPQPWTLLENLMQISYVQIIVTATKCVILVSWIRCSRNTCSAIIPRNAFIYSQPSTQLDQ